MVRGTTIGSTRRGRAGGWRALALGVVGTLGCAAPQSPRVLGVEPVDPCPGVRAVVEPRAWAEPAPGRDPDGGSPAGSGPTAADSSASPGIDAGLPMELDRRPRPVPLVLPLTRLSRTELGSGWAIDLGRGEAGYDDQPRPLGLDPIGAGGSPEALIQVMWAAPVGGGARVVGRASTTRMQDQALSEVFRDPELSWVALGVELSF